MFDLNVSSNSNFTCFDAFIGDFGLLEQIRFIILELHHQHLLCRQCDIPNLAEDLSLLFENVLQFASVEETDNQPSFLMTGNVTKDDAFILSFITEMVLNRGLLLTAVCLACILTRLERSNVSIIANSQFIKNFDHYEENIKIILEALVPDKTIKFKFCDITHCGIGAAVAAAIEDYEQKKYPGRYLFELKQYLKEKKTLFSIPKFLQLLFDPDSFNEALELAHKFDVDMKFDIPLSTIWAYFFMNEDYEKAEELFKVKRISLKEINYLVLRKLISFENIEMCKKYAKILKDNCPDQQVVIKAYRLLFDLFVFQNKYEEAMDLVQELMEMNIPLSNLKLSTLNILHTYMKRNPSTNKKALLFSLPLTETYSSSDSEEDSKSINSSK